MPTQEHAHEHVNRLLMGLPAPVRQRLLDLGEVIGARAGEVLHRSGEAPAYVHFPEGALISLIVSMEDGSAAEVGTVGTEGFLGLELALGKRGLPITARCQVSGKTLRLAADAFARELRATGSLRDRVHAYAQARLVEVARCAACGLLHSTEQRLARWLLLAHDRTSLERLPLTQEVLAEMLGVRRATVTAAAGRLQGTGSVRFTRGSVAVLDRSALVAHACEDYQAITDEYKRLLD